MTQEWVRSYSSVSRLTAAATGRRSRVDLGMRHLSDDLMIIIMIICTSRGAEYCDQPIHLSVCLCVCVRVCLSVCEHISGTPGPIFMNFLCRSPMAVARSCSGSIAIRYVLPVLWMTSCLAVMVVWWWVAIPGQSLMSLNALLLLLLLALSHHHHHITVIVIIIILVITPCLKKLCKIVFVRTSPIFHPPILIIFGRKMAKRLKLCKMHSFSTSSNSRHHTTVLNADVQNCNTTLKVVTCSKLSNDLNSTSKVKCGLLNRIISSYNSLVQNCQNLCSDWASRTWTQALRRRRHRKREATFAASRFLWLRRMCVFTEICHCTGLKGLNKMRCCLVFYFIPQTY